MVTAGLLSSSLTLEKIPGSLLVLLLRQERPLGGCGSCFYTLQCLWTLLGLVTHSSYWWKPVDTATCQVRLDRLCRVVRALLDTVRFLLQLATGKVGKAFGRLSAPQIVYPQLLEAVKMHKIHSLFDENFLFM